MTEVLHPEMRAVVAQDVTVRGLVTRISELMDIPEAQRALVLASGLTVQLQIDKIQADLEEAVSIVIDSPIMLEEAQSIAGRMATVCADSGVIETERKSLVKPLNDMVKWINAGYNAPRDYILGVKTKLNDKILAYHQEQQALARKREAEERERRRKEAEEAAAVEAKAIADAQALVESATAAQAAGSEQVADAMLNQAAVQVDVARQNAAVASAALYVPVTQGSSRGGGRASGVRDTYKGEVINKTELILAIAKQLAAGDKSNEDLLDVNQSNLNKRAEMQKLNLSLPGVTVTKGSAISNRKVAV